MVAGVAVIPFALLYGGTKFVAKKAAALGRGGKNLALTAGKVTKMGATAISDKIEPVKSAIKNTAKEVKETENARRESRNAKTFEEKAEIYESASKEAQEAIYEDDYKAALKENAKREREAARREKLHMSAEQQPINHEEANKHVYERADAQVLTEEEVKQVYGEK